MKLTLLTILLSCPVVVSSLSLPPQDFRNDVVQRHNELRTKHRVGPVTENQMLSLFAQEWADNLAKIGKLEHRQNNKYGENLAFMSDTSATGRNFVDLLYEAEQNYYQKMGYYDSEPNMNNFMHFGHFTQIVWKDSNEIGIGKAGAFVVINYNPAGNYEGQFKDNVLRPLI